MDTKYALQVSIWVESIQALNWRILKRAGMSRSNPRYFKVKEEERANTLFGLPFA